MLTTHQIKQRICLFCQVLSRIIKFNLLYICVDTCCYYETTCRSPAACHLWANNFRSTTLLFHNVNKRVSHDKRKRRVNSTLSVHRAHPKRVASWFWYPFNCGVSRYRKLLAWKVLLESGLVDSPYHSIDHTRPISLEMCVIAKCECKRSFSNKNTPQLRFACTRFERVRKKNLGSFTYEVW